jgi:hypothetical protein
VRWQSRKNNERIKQKKKKTQNKTKTKTNQPNPSVQHTLIRQEALQFDEAFERAGRHVHAIRRHVDVDHAGRLLVGQQLSADRT